MAIFIIETNNSLYMLDNNVWDDENATLTILHGTRIPDMPHMEPFQVESYELPQVGRAFRANLYLDETDNTERFTTSTVKRIIVK